MIDDEKKERFSTSSDPPCPLDSNDMIDDAALERAFKEDAQAEENQGHVLDFWGATAMENPPSAFFELLEETSLAQVDQAQRDEFEENQRLAEELCGESSFWHQEITASSPKQKASKQADASPVVLPVRKDIVQPAAANTETGGPDQFTPYAAAVWLTKHAHVIHAGGHLYFFDETSYVVKEKEDAERSIMDACRPAVELAGSSGFVKEVYRLLLMEPRICRNEDLQANVVVFNDCTLNVDTWQTIYHTPEIFATTRLNATYSDGRRSDCPNFKRFLQSICNKDQMLVQRIWEIVGYLLVPDQAGKAFFLFQGFPNSGKSVLGNFIRECFCGDVVSALDINELSGQFTLSNLVGRKLCVDFDLPADPFSKRAISKLKKLTGGDFMSSDVKFQSRVKFVNTAKLLFASNHAVLLPNHDEAFNNRMVVVPFATSVAKERQDYQLAKKLAAERSAIIVQALSCYKTLVRNSYCFAGNYRPNEVLDNALGLYGIDAVAVFLQHRCEPDAEVWTPSSILYASFCETIGDCCCGLNEFSQLLLQLCDTQGLPVEKERNRLTPGSNPIYGFKGLKIKGE